MLLLELQMLFKQETILISSPLTRMWNRQMWCTICRKALAGNSVWLYTMTQILVVPFVCLESGGTVHQNRESTLNGQLSKLSHCSTSSSLFDLTSPIEKVQKPWILTFPAMLLFPLITGSGFWGFFVFH